MYEAHKGCFGSLHRAIPAGVVLPEAEYAAPAGTGAAGHLGGEVVHEYEVSSVQRRKGELNVLINHRIYKLLQLATVFALLTTILAACGGETPTTPPVPAAPAAATATSGTSN